MTVPTNVFFIHTAAGQVATATQLREAGMVDEATDTPPAPWHPISGPHDASTMWYVVMRKRTRGIFIGTLCIRHVGRQASLEQEGWEEVPIEEIGVQAAAAPGRRDAG
ncbi:MAG: hypothetical protein QOG63_688 [Thermoleophilaceae bacterium]|nr:hypothetical protein [Thermoleophilaceae bacterium]